MNIENPEGSYRPELNADEMEIAARLKEKGPEDKEAMDALLSWLDKEQLRAGEIGTPRANMEVDLKLALLKMEAGFRDDAREMLEEIWNNAGEEDEDVVNAVRGMLEELQD
jgi:hypothetical protein